MTSFLAQTMRLVTHSSSQIKWLWFKPEDPTTLSRCQASPSSTAKPCSLSQMQKLTLDCWANPSHPSQSCSKACVSQVLSTRPQPQTPRRKASASNWKNPRRRIGRDNVKLLPRKAPPPHTSPTAPLTAKTQCHLKITQPNHSGLGRQITRILHRAPCLIPGL